MKSLLVTALAMMALVSPLVAQAGNEGGQPQPAAEEKPAAPPAEPPDEARKLVEGLGPKELVPLLGHARFKVRQAAEDRLKEILQDDPQPVGEACYDAYSRDPDPEVRMRARSVLLVFVTKSGASAGRGFVGIRLHLHAFYDAQGELRFAIKVGLVQPGTPASQVGMMMGDMVTAIDAVDLNNPDGDRKFMDYVARKAPGNEVVLVVDRAGKTFKHNVTLARRPPENLGEDDGLDPEALFRDFLRRKQDEKAPAPAKAKP